MCYCSPCHSITDVECRRSRWSLVLPGAPPASTSAASFLEESLSEGQDIREVEMASCSS